VNRAKLGIMTTQFTLGKNERLKSRKLIEKLFSEGKKFTINPFKVYYIQSLLSEEILSGTVQHLVADNYWGIIQFGIGVSTKFFKKAVDRNRVKRVTKEAYRLQKKALQEKLKQKKIRMNIFFIYNAKELPVYKEIYNQVGLILSKLDKIADEIK
jgi:ribonuclease P protein component